ncbi:MAG: hypothetical protein PHQ28_04360 [Mycobacterium sp.]|nr:hypothetical protein [Mycobacterium sp.]
MTCSAVPRGHNRSSGLQAEIVDLPGAGHSAADNADNAAFSETVVALVKHGPLS